MVISLHKHLEKRRRQKLNNNYNRIEKAFKNYKNILKLNNDKFITLDRWLEKESNIFIKETINNLNKKYPKFKRGQIIKVDFGINIGSELSHTHFAIVLNSDDSLYNDNITVIPITSKSGYKRIPIGKILKEAIPKTEKYNLDCYAYLTQIKTISKNRILKNNINYICDKNILDLIDKNIINYLTKS